MPRRTFKNVSVELLEYAECAAIDFKNRGYHVSIERDDLGFPYTPTLLCKRQSTTIIVEFYSHILMDRVDDWVAFARSSGRDTRVAVCLPPKAKVAPKHEQELRSKGVGLYVATGSELIEKILPNDLALNIKLPALASLPAKVRQMLGPAYEQFNRSQWREGFEDACQAFENAARRYFKAGCAPSRGRIVLIRRSGPYIPTSQQINRMTLGQLALAFSQIQSQTHADQVIGQALSRINRDRVGVVHHKSKVTTENRLRTNVGRHMWTIVAAMKELA
jgi:hypothetical protein